VRGGCQGVAFQATWVWGCACPGDNRQSPIGTGYSKMFVFQTKFDYMVGGLGTKRSEMKRMAEGQAYT
jgi:hypothetical protein